MSPFRVQEIPPTPEARSPAQGKPWMEGTDSIEYGQAGYMNTEGYAGHNMQGQRGHHGVQSNRSDMLRQSGNLNGDIHESDKVQHLHSPRPSSRGKGTSTYMNSDIPEPNLLAPEDAFYAYSPPKGSQRGAAAESYVDKVADGRAPSAGRTLRAEGMSAARAARRRREKDRGRSGSRKVWKKLLWVKQSYPDNYTDSDTFLDHLQRNPRLQPYDFWPLVADSTVIVQHVCSVIIFVCCFVVIFQERVSPVSVVSWSTLGSIIGWAVWDFWVTQEEAAAAAASLERANDEYEGGAEDALSSISGSSNGSSSAVPQASSSPPSGLGINTSPPLNRRPGSSQAGSRATSPLSTTPTSGLPPYPPPSWFSPRNQQRLATLKSAILIYSALLGLSPILKSLTKSTTSDSIWAMSCWLMCINVFFFDYGGGSPTYSLSTSSPGIVGTGLGREGAKFPASLSTNAALMASTVLASRLPSTTHVFSLTLFSIEVFGLFPVFRRHLRSISWRGHLILTILLVMGAGGGVGVTLGGPDLSVVDAVKRAVSGIVLGSLLMALGMGGCSWWLIGLQKYKNEIHGPWDPARPVIRRRWD